VIRVLKYNSTEAKEARFPINTTSSSDSFGKQLSPFLLGPIELYDGIMSQNMENAWQYSKVYKCHLDDEGNPSEEWYSWAKAGWDKKKADRYPMGRGAKPEYSWWEDSKLGYVDARKKIYAPLYAELVEQTKAYEKLKQMYEKEGELVLLDYDAYDHNKLGFSYTDVINCEHRKMGHAFVLAMMLDNERVWE
jgi:hypothetical protein